MSFNKQYNIHMTTNWKPNFKKPFFMSASHSNYARQKENLFKRATPFLCFYALQYGPDTHHTHIGYSNNLATGIECFKAKTQALTNNENKEQMASLPIVLFTITGFEDPSKVKRLSVDFHRMVKEHKTLKMKDLLTFEEMCGILHFKITNFKFQEPLTLHCWFPDAITNVMVHTGLMPGNQEKKVLFAHIDNEQLPDLSAMKTAVDSSSSSQLNLNKTDEKQTNSPTQPNEQSKISQNDLVDLLE
jgi:hypothetical protein